jgi:hypothetical protein
METRKKYIIGLGCSWTQGEGGYPEEIWQQYNGRVQLRGVDDYHLRKYEHENSWVNVLCRDHFTDHTPINLGVRGIGNFAAVNQLHFCNRIDWQNSTGIIVLMLSGFERFDVFQQHPKYDRGQDDFYSNNEYVHYKWRTAWPVINHNTGDSAFWNTYGKELWSEQFVASWQMINLLNVQTFAKANNFKLVVANAFNQPPNGVYEYLKEYTGSLVDTFNWNNYIHNKVDYVAFMQKLVELDGLISKKDWGGYFNVYRSRSWPSTYLTNCEGAHPTILGYKVIASELAQFINSQGYV